MRFFTISTIIVLLALSGVGCIQSIQGGAVLTHAPEQMYVRTHTVDLRFVLHGRVVESATVTVTEIPGYSVPPTFQQSFTDGYLRINISKKCTALDVRVSIGSLNIHPITVPNRDGTYTIYCEEEMEKEDRE